MSVRSLRSGFALALLPPSGGRPPEIGPEKLEAIIAALNGGATKAAVCRTFGAKRTTLIETLARAGWPGPGTTATCKELECPSPS